MLEGSMAERALYFSLIAEIVLLTAESFSPFQRFPDQSVIQLKNLSRSSKSSP